MADVKTQLDVSLQHLGRSILRDGGQVRREDAEARALQAYERFDASRRLARKARVDQELAELKRADQALPATPRRRPKPDA